MKGRFAVRQGSTIIVASTHQQHLVKSTSITHCFGEFDAPAIFDHRFNSYVRRLLPVFERCKPGLASGHNTQQIAGSDPSNGME